MSKVRSGRRSGFRARRAAVAMAALAALGIDTAARGSNFYWAGDNASNGNAWNATTGLGGTNWSSSPDFNNPTAGLPGAGDDVFFYLQPLNLSNILGQDFSIRSLTFLGGTSATPTSDVTIGGGNTLTINAGGISVQQFSGTETLNTNVALGTAQTWTHNGANPLLVNGVVSGAAASNLTLAGTGAVTFTAANSYAGTTNLSTNGVTLNLSGASGSILSSTALTLNGGSVLNLDNSIANNANRIADAAGITSLGGTINLKGSSATETLGTVTLSTTVSGGLATGATRVNVDAGSTLTINGLNRAAGGTINFSPTGTVKLPSVTNTNGIIGGYATIGNIGSVQQDAAANTNVLDFAAVDGSNNVIPLPAASYTPTFAAGNNTQVNTLAALPAATVTTTNSLYVTGAARVQIGADNTTTSTLVIQSGGIISNGASQTLGGAGPQIDMTNSAVIGNSTISANNAGGGNVTGILTAGTTASLVNDLVVTTASNLRINAIIADNGTTKINLVKNGSGTLDLSDGNGTTVTSTYTGKTIINGGLVTIRNDRNFGAVPATNTPDAITLNGGEYRMTATITLATARGTTVGPQGGTISYNGGSTTQLAGYLVTGPGSIQYSCIPGFGNVSANQCAMNVNFGTTNYQGATTFFTHGSTNANPVVAVIYFGGNDKVPDTSAVTVTTAAGSGGSKGILNLFGKSDTWGSLAGDGDILNGVATVSNLTVGGNNLSTTYSGSLGKTGVTWSVGAAGTAGADVVNGANSSTSAITLTKVGSGVMTMSGTNGYTGATSINGGMLNVTGSLANTPVSVGNGSLSGSLGGTGTVNGSVLVTSTGHLSPSASSSTTSNLTINNNLTINGGATFDFNFGAPGTSDTITVTGTTLLNSGTDLLNITALPGFGIGTYNLITSTGTLTNNATSFTINGSNKFNYSVAQSGNNLVLNVTQGNPILTWIGSVNGNWVAGGPTNWNDGTSAVAFANTNNVIFDDNGLARSSVTVDAAGVTPNSIDISNTTGSYSIGGGSIGVATTITKSQPGAVTFNSAVTTPLTTVTGGTLTVGAGGVFNSTTLRVDATGALVVASGGSLGSNTTGLTVNGPVTLNNAAQTITTLGDTSNATTGVLTLNGTALTISGTAAYDGRITGSGSVTVSGSTTLSNGTNNFTGGTNVTGTGTLTVTNSTGSATGTGAVTVGTAGGPTPGPTLAGSGVITGPITIHTNATLAGTGTFGSSVTLNGTLAPAGAATVGTVTVGSLTSNSGAKLNFDLGAIGPGTTSDTANVNGTLSLSGAQTINVNMLAGFGQGTYTLFTATGAITNNATYTVTGVTLPRTQTTVTQPTPNTLALNVTVAALRWTGATNNVWDIDNAPTTPGTANWTDNSATFTTYIDPSSVTFADGAANTNPISIAQNVSPGVMTFTNTTATPYTIGVAGDAGVITGSASIVKTGNGIVTLAGANTFTGTTTVTAGTVSISADANLGAAPAAVDAAHLVLNGGTLQATAALTLAANRGVQVGPAGGTFNVAPATIAAVGGVIADMPTTAGVVNKTGTGELDLNSANTFTGGLNVNAGIVRLNNGAAGGNGVVTVNTTGTLALGADVNNTTSITLAGGTLGETGGDRVINGNLVAATGTTSTLSVNDIITGLGGRTGTGIVLNGVLSGSGNLVVTDADATTNNPDSSGFRLRGTGASTYSGTITVGQKGKFELQTTVTTPFSPMGTGKIVMTGGTIDNAAAGTFSILNLRDNAAGDATFGNDLQVTGSGFALLNLLGSAAAGTSIGMGKLTIGGGQTLAAVANGGTTHVLSFTSVSLTGGDAGFAPRLPGNGTYNTNQTISVGAITETAAGSGIVLNGVSNLILRAANNYTGNTTVQAGTLVAGVAGALPATTNLIVNGGTLDVNNAGVGSASQTVASLAGTGGTITNSDTTAQTLTVNQAGNTTFAGVITGSLGLTKSGAGTLSLTGTAASTYTGPTTVTGGTLRVNGVLSATAVTIQAGRLDGTGDGTASGSIAGPVTIGNGALTGGVRDATLAPGNSVGTIGTGALTFAADGIYAVELDSAVPAADKTITTDVVTINPGAALTLADLGSVVLPLGTKFTIIQNGSASAVTGSFAGMGEGSSMAAGLNTYQISYVDNVDAGAVPNDVTLTVAVPEPASIGLLGTAVAAGLLARRRRRR